jgi:2-polyprenyl-3-methyl-5-hydroxy-6-metoxy-1,4-benzoquinol methylase
MKEFARRSVQRLPALWRAWLDFRHALRLLETDAFSRRRYFNRVHIENFWDYTAKPHKERNDLILRALDAQKADSNGRVLEIGCSEGVFTLELAKRYAVVEAVDVSEVACERARSRCKQHLNVTIRERDMMRAPLQPHEKFDLIVIMDVFGYLCRRQSQVEEFTGKLNRSLNTHGMLVFADCRMAEQQREAWWQRWFPFGADAHLMNLEAIPSVSTVWKDVLPSFEDVPAHLMAILRKGDPDASRDAADAQVLAHVHTT